MEQADCSFAEVMKTSGEESIVQEVTEIQAEPRVDEKIGRVYFKKASFHHKV